MQFAFEVSLLSGVSLCCLHLAFAFEVSLLSAVSLSSAVSPCLEVFKNDCVQWAGHPTEVSLLSVVSLCL